MLVEKDLQRVQAVATRIVCMLEGRVVADAPAAELSRAQITAHYFGAQRPESARTVHHAGSPGEASADNLYKVAA